MSEELIKTGVDELLELLGSGSKIPLADAAKKLDVTMDVVQAWVDFLVEERIVGIEYKFTTPFIYLNKPMTAKGTEQSAEDSITILTFKKEFFDRARKNNIPETHIEKFWKNHLSQELELKKKYFYFEANQRKINNIDGTWKEYESNILSY
jgi:hypothetical protein